MLNTVIGRICSKILNSPFIFVLIAAVLVTCFALSSSGPTPLEDRGFHLRTVEQVRSLDRGDILVFRQMHWLFVRADVGKTGVVLRVLRSPGTQPEFQPFDFNELRAGLQVIPMSNSDYTQAISAWIDQEP